MAKAWIWHFILLNGKTACGRVGLGSYERATANPKRVTCEACKRHETMSAQDILRSWRG